jgi:hypothetical protein
VEQNKSPENGATNTVFAAGDLNESHNNGQQEIEDYSEPQELGYDCFIPGYVRHSGLDDSTMVLFGDIRSLTKKKGYCYATNDFLAKIHNVDERTISKRINLLVKAGFLQAEMINTPRGTVRRLYLAMEQVRPTSTGWNGGSRGVENPFGGGRTAVPPDRHIDRNKDTNPNPQSGDFFPSEDMSYRSKPTPRELGTNPRAMGTNPRAVKKSTIDTNEDLVHTQAREWVKRRNAPEIAIVEGQHEGSRAVSLRYNRQTVLTKLETPRLLNWINDRLREMGGNQWLIEADQLANVL